MNESSFKSRLIIIQDKLHKAKSSYDFKTGEETWENIGTNPFDIAFTELSELYLEADNVQRKQIFEYAGIHGLPNDLWYFIRRVGKQIQLESDTKWLQMGIAGALIDGARGDFRDLIVSLTLLRFSAELQGIDTRPFFDNAIQSAEDQLKPILTNVRDDNASSLHYSAQVFGPSDWVTKSIDIFGVHPLYQRPKPKEKKKGFWGLFSK